MTISFGWLLDLLTVSVILITGMGIFYIIKSILSAFFLHRPR